MLKWLWCLVRVDAFQIAVARLCHHPLLWGSRWLGFKRGAGGKEGGGGVMICANQKAKQLISFSRCDTEKVAAKTASVCWFFVFFFINRVRDLCRYNKPVDNNDRLTANTAHIVERKTWLCRKWLLLCVSARRPTPPPPEKQCRPVWCGALRHGCWTNKVRNQTEADGA